MTEIGTSDRMPLRATLALTSAGIGLSIVASLAPRSLGPGTSIGLLAPARRYERNIRESPDAILKPKSIAVIGASRREDPSAEKLHQLVEFDFHGKLFPVTPKADFIHSIKAFPNVLSIPDPVDLAIIAAPREEVLGGVDDCGKKGVTGLVVITSGFSESGDDGRALEGPTRRADPALRNADDRAELHGRHQYLS